MSLSSLILNVTTSGDLHGTQHWSNVYYGDTPWHKLGNKRAAPANIEEALTHGGLNWHVDLIPLQTAEPLPQAFLE